MTTILPECGLAEAILAARAAGPLTPDHQRLLDEHLAGCSACTQLARELEAPHVAEALVGDPLEGNFDELTLIAYDNYARGHEIGRGGMGQIVHARDRRLGRAVAIKELIDPRLRGRFEHEARLTARLQHPAIVTIYEAGRWPSGDPFYAMKYVAGRPLDQVIARLGTVDERLTLLANLTIVVEAIAYAHSEGVVHRDLKPHNILVGPFGETVVIDWGLAKDLRSATGPEAVVRGDDRELTQAGAGTPAYMAPEQARGEPPDERVDVYALGATLHHVLAGDRPDLRPLPEATPRDLRAIVAKAMAEQPADRYPTATELAGELRRFQDGQLVAAHRYTASELVQRWIRRHRAAVAVAAAGLLLVAAGAGLSVHRIIAERDRADAQRHAAEGLVDFMLGTLRERLQPIGRLDALADLGREVERYFAAIDAAGSSDESALRDRSRALRLLAGVDMAKGNLDGSWAELLRTRELCERRHALAPSADTAACLISVLEGMAGVVSYRGDSVAAMPLYASARDHLDAALVRYPDDPRLRAVRGELHYFIGRERAKLRDSAGARAAYRDGIVAEQALVEDATGKPDTLEQIERLDQLATLHTGLADLEADAGHPEVALPEYDAAAAIRDRLRKLDGDSTASHILWALESGTAAQAQTLMGDYGAARRRLQQALGVLRHYARDDPENALWQSFLGTLELHGCTNQTASGELDDAVLRCRTAAEIFDAILSRNAGRESAALNLAAAEAVLAEGQLARGDLDGSARAAARAVEVAERGNREHLGRFVWLLAVAKAQLRAAAVARAGGRRAEAAAALQAARAAVAGPSQSGENFEAELELARIELFAAVLAYDASDRPSAEMGLRRTRSRLERAMARWPHVAELQGQLAFAAVQLAETTSDPTEARSLREQALQLLEPLQQRGALGLPFRGLPERARQGQARQIGNSAPTTGAATRPFSTAPSSLWGSHR